MIRMVARTTGRITIAIALATIASQRATPPDTVLVNAHIVTVDARFSIAQAVAIANGRFRAVGTTDRITGLAGPKTATIDLRGQTVVPGLADDHCTKDIRERRSNSIDCWSEDG